jgi:acyl-CoA thioesterase I
MKAGIKSTILWLSTAVLFCSCAAVPKRDSRKTVIQEECMEKSLVSVGNNYRFMKAVRKAGKGEQVTIAYLGGSITEGALAQPQAENCYAYLSYRYFAEHYAKDKAKVQYINAGISGTPSMLGIERCNNDILSANPDIVFVEFAVNDDARISDLHDTYESLVRKLLNSPSQPAVILVFTLGHTNSFWSAQDVQQKIGKQYDLGMISVRDAIQEKITTGKMRNEDYFSADGIHPDNSGHKLIASFIENYFKAASSKTPDTSFVVPDNAVFSKAYENLQNVEINGTSIRNTGSFKPTEKTVWTYKNCWTHNTESNEPLVLELTCSRIIIAFQQKKETTYGNADVFVDGTKVSTIEGYSPTAWNNCAAMIAWKNDTTAPHTVEIKMAPGDEKKELTILGMGYK